MKSRAGTLRRLLAVCVLVLPGCGGDPGTARVATPAPPAPAGGPAGAFRLQVDGARVSLDARAAGLGEVLTALTAAFGVDLQLAEALNETVTVRIEEADFETSVARLLDQRGYAVRFGADGSDPRALFVFGARPRDPGLAALDLALSDPDPQERAAALLGLVRRPEAGAESNERLTRLQDALRDGHPMVRGFALDALSEVGGDAAVAALEPLLLDDDVQVREEAVHTLAQLDGAAAQRLLRVAMRDSSDGVRQAAAAALAERRMTVR